MLEITSSSNNKCKYVKSLSQKKSRQKYGEYTIEGIKSVSDALNSEREITALYVSDSFFENEKFKYPKDISLYKVQDDVFMKMCDTKAPQGILAVVKIEDETDFTPNTEKSYIYCDCINDPGNLGTIIRTADAAGFDGVLLSDGCVDLYSPKTVRSSMGSFFNMKVVTGVSYEKLSEYKNSGFQLIGGALGDNTIDYRSADMKKPTIIIVGNEANGISEDVQKMTDTQQKVMKEMAVEQNELLKTMAEHEAHLDQTCEQINLNQQQLSDSLTEFTKAAQIIAEREEDPLQLDGIKDMLSGYMTTMQKLQQESAQNIENIQSAGTGKIQLSSKGLQQDEEKWSKVLNEKMDAWIREQKAFQERLLQLEEERSQPFWSRWGRK